MALRDLLVQVDQSQGALVRLRLAADLARRHGSRLTALYVREPDTLQLHSQSTAEFGLVSATDINLANRQMQKTDDETAQRLGRELATISIDSGLEVELRTESGAASSMVPRHARFADLCIVSQDTRSDATTAGYSFSETVLFSAGRPVLFVPARGSFDALGRHILVAWNSSRASARALNDALPLIERAERTTVLGINRTEYAKEHNALPPEQIVEHIRRHTGTAEGLWLDDIPRELIAEALQDEAHRVGADMIVAGAFGHPKLWEKLIGGVTCDLLAGMTLPILMSY